MEDQQDQQKQEPEFRPAKGNVVESAQKIKHLGDVVVEPGDLMKVLAVDQTHCLIENPAMKGSQFKVEFKAVKKTGLPDNFFELSENERAELLGVDEVTDGPVEF